MATGGMVLAGLFLGFGIWRTGDRFLSGLGAIFTAPQPEPQVDIQSLVLEEIRGASELTTAIFAMQAVVPTSRERTFGGYTIGTTTLLYIAFGEVRAGVDLSQLTPANVIVNGEALTLQLPPPQILDSKIDVNRSSVYDYDRGFLGLGPDSAPELQSLAQRETLRQIVETACNEGVLEEANARAQVAVTQLLTTAGYEQFRVETQPPNPQTCISAVPLSDPPPASAPAPAPVPGIDETIPIPPPPAPAL